MEETMSLNGLIDPKNAKSVAHMQATSPGSWGATHFTYLLWDTQPVNGWLPADHSLSATLPSSNWRPLYLGKAAGWASVKRHLTKDEFGIGARLPTDKNAINEGLLAYCLNKRRPGWLAMSVISHNSGAEAQQLEQEGVRHLGWRKDVRSRKKFSSAEVRSAIALGPDEWRRTLEGLRSHYADLMTEPTPTGQGLLFNQMEPVADGRGH
jgi:hypothetical protein